MRKLAWGSALFLAMSGVVACSDGTTDLSEPRDDQHVGQVTQEWAAASATSEAKSTHLWIVDRAITMLATSSDPKALAMREMMNGATCRAQWQQGLLDADYIRFYNQGGADLTPGANIFEGALALASSNTTWESHFYDPDTGLNYKKNTVTARSQAARYLTFARAASFRGGSVHATEWGWDGPVYQAHDLTYSTCYALGLALHYFTDMTQGQHASNFTALSLPAMLHEDYEEYAESIQDRVRQRPMPPIVVSNDSADAILEQTARASKAQWKTTYDKILSVKRVRCPLDDLSVKDSKLCWAGDPAIDTLILDALDAARAATTRYLISVSDLATQPQAALIGDAIGVTSVAYHGGNLYVTSNDQIWRRGATWVGSGNDWSNAGIAYGATAMVSHGGALYVASGGHLWKRNALGPNTGNDWAEAGVALGVTALASVGGSLYAVSNDHLWKRGALGPDTGNDWTEAGLAFGVRAMTAWNDQLYVVSNDALWRRDPGTLSPGSGNAWTRVALFPFVNGIAAQGSYLWVTTTDNQLRLFDMRAY